MAALAKCMASMWSGGAGGDADAALFPSGGKALKL
jgi:hypothetical protein